MDRRYFLKNTVLGTVASTWMPWNSILANPELAALTILHTNDVHSRVEPFPMDGGRNEGLGGAVSRALKIEEIRKEGEHVLLLDAGDIFQGTPYFNFFDGEIEIKLMNEMGYDFATIGNHDFDGGIENLGKQLDNANFKMVNSNYGFENTPLKGKVEPYNIIRKGGIKIGIYGLGIELNSLVPDELYGETVYNDPLVTARRLEHLLKNDEKCDYIICLSHLGYRYNGNKVSDFVIATSTAETDLIIGGHTHTFMKAPEIYFNRSGNQVLVNQVGWAGLMLGRIDVVFERNKKNKCVNCKNTWLGES